MEHVWVGRDSFLKYMEHVWVGIDDLVSIAVYIRSHAYSRSLKKETNKHVHPCFSLRVYGQPSPENAGVLPAVSRKCECMANRHPKMRVYGQPSPENAGVWPAVARMRGYGQPSHENPGVRPAVTRKHIWLVLSVVDAADREWGVRSAVTSASAMQTLEYPLEYPLAYPLEHP